MSDNGKSSQTMRIDLIPDVPAEPVSSKKKKVVISTPTRKHRQATIESAKSVETSQYQELLQSIYDTALVTDMSGQVKDVNVRAVEKLLYSREEMLSLNIGDIISGADENLIQTLCENLENERFTIIQAYCVRNDDTFFPAEISVNKLHFDEMQLCFFLRDITVRVQREEMLRTTYNAIQNSGDGIAVVDVDAKLEYVNPKLAGMTAFTDTEQMLGLELSELFDDSEDSENIVREVLENNAPWIGEVAIKRQDGAGLDVQVSAAGNLNSDGQPLGMVISFVDISDHKRAEQAEREAERRRVMLESVGAACHHLGQPATVLLANLGIIRKKLPESDDVLKGLVETSIQAVESLSEILHKLNAVNEYKTTQYLDKGDSGGEESRIIEIE